MTIKLLWAYARFQPDPYVRANPVRYWWAVLVDFVAGTYYTLTGK